MSRISMVGRLGTALLAVAAASLSAPAQGPARAPAPSAPATPASDAAARGVRCPQDFETVFDASTKVLRCRRDVVSWVVTSCPERGFATYLAKPGADGCGPTEIPGVGVPPGSSGSRPVACASQGYTVVADRTGPRDRCERTDRVFALPRPVS